MSHDQDDLDQDDPRDDDVRRLLASARSSEPTPPEVVARLDDVLASLVAERTSASSEETPVDLSVERAHRRRRWIGVAAAAAVVVAAGAAVPTLLTGQQQADDAMSAAEDTSSGLPELSAESLPAQVKAYVRTLPEERDLAATPQRGARPEPSTPTPLSGAESDAVPSPPGVVPGSVCGWRGDGQAYPVSYDGTRADLVLSPGQRGRVVARVVTCDGDEDPTVARTVVLSADDLR